MKRRRHGPRSGLLAVLTLCASLTLRSAAAAEIAEFSLLLDDAARDRAVPVRIVHPSDLQGRHPIVLLSHGLGGSTDAMRYLGDHLAAAGWIAVHMQHPGSDAALWAGRAPEEIREALTASLRDPANAIARFRDPAFVLDALGGLDAGTGVLAGHLDLDHVALAGHSYGARGALVAAGERLGRFAPSFREPRIDAVVALSPNLPMRGEPRYGDIAAPILHVTGTDDGQPLDTTGTFDPAERTEPFARIEGVAQYLLVLDGADHATFGGRRLGTDREREADAAHAALIAEVTATFLAAHVLDDAAARSALVEDVAGRIATGDRWDWKHPGD